jgi:transcriptional regulator GlxA family with amidase domain
MTPRRIAITAYDGVSLLDLAGPLEAFRIASAFAGPRGRRVAYECSVVSVAGGKVKTSDGVELVTAPARSIKAPIDTLIVPGAFLVEDVTRDKKLIQWVRTNAPACRRVCSVCVGSFMLAAAGILDGKRAATHWMHAPLLATRHPQVTVEPDAIFVRDGRVWSSAGVTTGIDLALALIEQDAGRDVAMNVARILVVYLKRAGGQSQYSALLAAQAESESDLFSELDQWIAEHLTADLKVEALADRVHMSPRNFARAYAAKRGRTPAKAVEAIRVDAARRKLEETDDRIETIADDCGFGTEEQMRCAFLRTVKVTPREYRKRFASNAFQAKP